MSQSITVTMDGTLLNWLKKVGDSVNSGEVIAEIEADKATVEIEAPGNGTLLELSAQVGDEIKEGAVIGTIGAAGEAPKSSAEAAKPVEAKQEAPQSENGKAPVAEEPETAEAADGNLPNGVKASPLARRIAEEKGVDLSQVKGTGPGGRVTKTDIEGFTPSAAPAPAAARSAAPSLPGAPTRKFPEGPDIEVIELTTMRKRIVAATVESKQFTPHFYVTTDIDAEPLLALRKQLNDSLPEGANKISVNDMVVKAAALTLRQFPNLNSHFYGDKIARHKSINIGIAVALPNGGLINVVAHDADKISLGTLATQNKERIARAREGKVKPDDISGATFTVSNLGPYDVEHFIAIINPPEAAILAVATATKVPVVKADGTVGVGNRMKITISVDHRVSDGAEGASYLQALKGMIENPMRLLV
jgi:pyruvate dehydrogenase E2 component (dihydrolipoamide acetyltransferase)